MSTSNNVNSKLNFSKKIEAKFTQEQYLLDIKNGDKRIKDVSDDAKKNDVVIF